MSDRRRAIECDWARLVRSGVVALCCGVGIGTASAAPVNTVFELNPQASSLRVEAEARGFSDSDAHALAGTINATIDFPGGVAFPPQAGFTITSANIAATGPFELRLGLPRPLPGVDVTVSGLAADVATPSPPGVMTALPTGAIRYQFDAAQFVVTANRGLVVVSGLVDDMTNLAEAPVSGASPTGTLGTIVFTTNGTSGPFTRVDALLDLPIDISTVVAVGDPPDVENVMLDLDATVVARASFWTALAGVPGDFDADSDVDGADLARWRAGFGELGTANVDDGDADGDRDVDGADFLVWQRNLGLTPPAESISGAFAAPEPGAACLAAGALLAGGRLVRLSRREGAR
jgi:hypothetical protein